MIKGKTRIHLRTQSMVLASRCWRQDADVKILTSRHPEFFACAMTFERLAKRREVVPAATEAESSIANWVKQHTADLANVALSNPKAGRRVRSLR